MTRARDWARRMALSVLAGGGLTAAGIGGPGALAAETPAGGSVPSQPPSSTTPAPGPSAQDPGQSTATTTTANGAATTTTTVPSASVPPAESSATPGPVPSGTSKQPSSAPGSHAHGPAVVEQHTQLPSTGGTPFHPGTPYTVVPPQPVVSHPAAPAVVPSADIVPAPSLAAGQVPASSLLAGSLVSMQALGFYRIPMFLLPIYQAAAAQYGVPWQILAAINEVETDYGTDLSVSTAGAVGWMQFMPETWLQYGVDALNAGYADPYNPVDAIFAAARYLHAAGASSDLHAAILAYNHSQAYVESVLLRARLIASYPGPVIATLTGLTEGSPPVAGARLAGAAPGSSGGSSSATGQAIPLGAQGPGQPGVGSGASASSGVAPEPGAPGSSATGQATALPGSSGTGQATAALPGSTPAPAPSVSAAAAEKLANAPAPPSQLARLLGVPHAPVVAVEDGRIVGLGRSHKLGNYLVLRDTYGDVFTYAGLGSIVPSLHLAKPAQLSVPTGALRGSESAKDPAPIRAASGGQQPPLTLHVVSKTPATHVTSARSVQLVAPPAAPSTQDAAVRGGKVRVFAHPGNPDAQVAIRVQAARSKTPAPGWVQLTAGSLVTQGTVLGHLGGPTQGVSSSLSPPADTGVLPRQASLRFAIRPAGAQGAVDPGPILDNWRQLDVALHPRGARGGDVLAGATAASAFALSGEELHRAVLSDPHIRLSACDRRQVAAGKVDSHLLALLVFLSRSGLGPTVGQLRCVPAHGLAARPAAPYVAGRALRLTAINGVPIPGHQGAGSIADLTIRTLLAAKHGFVPKRIVSLMHYPGMPATMAQADHGDYIEIQMATPNRRGHTATALAARASGAHSATSPAMPLLTLDTAQWRQLVSRIGGLAQPKVPRQPSSAAIGDSQPSPQGKH